MIKFYIIKYFADDTQDSFIVSDGEVESTSGISTVTEITRSEYASYCDIPFEKIMNLDSAASISSAVSQYKMNLLEG